MNGSDGVIDIGSGKTTFTDAGAYNLVASQDMVITGAGSLILSTVKLIFTDGTLLKLC